MVIRTIEKEKKLRMKHLPQDNIQESTCDRCEMFGYFWRLCRTPRYRMDMKKYLNIHYIF